MSLKSVIEYLDDLKHNILHCNTLEIISKACILVKSYTEDINGLQHIISLRNTVKQLEIARTG